MGAEARDSPSDRLVDARHLGPQRLVFTPQDDQSCVVEARGGAAGPVHLAQRAEAAARRGHTGESKEARILLEAAAAPLQLLKPGGEPTDQSTHEPIRLAGGTHEPIHLAYGGAALLGR